MRSIQDSPLPADRDDGILSGEREYYLIIKSKWQGGLLNHPSTRGLSLPGTVENGRPHLGRITKIPLVPLDVLAVIKQIGRVGDNSSMGSGSARV